MINSKPDLAVIDQAIRMINHDWNTYTCVALDIASGGCWTYKRQYRMYIESINEGKVPYWWDHRHPFKEERIKALEGFKQACIDAGNK